MKKVKLSSLADGQIFKRTEKSKVKFKVITSGKFGVVVTSLRSEYSALMKGAAFVYI